MDDGEIEVGPIEIRLEVSDSFSVDDAAHLADELTTAVMVARGELVSSAGPVDTGT
jgi:hypothetical protein